MRYFATRIVLLIGVVACGKGGDGGGSKSTQNKKPVTYDLGSARTRWKGWKVTAPPGCKVMKDLIGVRLGCGGDGLDIILRQGIEDFEELKKMSRGRWTKLAAKMLTDEPGLLEWIEGEPSARVRHFVMQLSVGAKSASCRSFMGAESDARHAAQLAACRSLAFGTDRAVLDTSGRNPAKTPVSSCDERAAKARCTDAFPAAWTMGEKTVRGNCTTGTFAKAPCPAEQRLGFCDVGHAYRISYYAGTSLELDAAGAAKACKDEFTGTFAPATR
jgi:hypothetical protein